MGVAGPALYFASRSAWRRWLARHHDSKGEVWVAISKKGSPKRSVSLSDAVEEAICFGWIDSRIRSQDEQTSAVRFTPRRDPGNWSRYNIARAFKMLSEGRMTEAGIRVLPARTLEAWEQGKRGPSIVDPRRRTIAYSGRRKTRSPRRQSSRK